MRCIEFRVVAGGRLSSVSVLRAAVLSVVGVTIRCVQSWRTEDAVTARNVSRRSVALARARERRRALDGQRDEQDRRVEEATATALVTLDGRAEAQQALAAATAELATAVGRLMAVVPAERVAALLQLEPADVRRLARQAAGRAAEPQGQADSAPRRTG